MLNVAVMAGFICLPVFADDVSDLIDNGKDAWKKGDSIATVASLQQAIQKIQAESGKAITACFPEAPAGWVAEEIENTAWSGSSGEGMQSMINLSREYTQEADDLRCTINITNWPQMVDGLRASIAGMADPAMRPMLKQAGIGASSQSAGGWEKVTVINTQDAESQVIMTKGAVMVHVVLNSADPALLGKFVGGIKLDRLATGR